MKFKVKSNLTVHAIKTGHNVEQEEPESMSMDEEDNSNMEASSKIISTAKPGPKTKVQSQPTSSSQNDSLSMLPTVLLDPLEIQKNTWCNTPDRREDMEAEQYDLPAHSRQDGRAEDVQYPLSCRSVVNASVCQKKR